MGLDLCFKLINGQLLSNYSRYAYANLTMKAVSFFHHPVQGVGNTVCPKKGYPLKSSASVERSNLNALIPI